MKPASRVECKHEDKAFELNALRKSIIAFGKIKPTSKHKRETLYYAFEQIKPLIKRYMQANKILALELDLRTLHCLTLEPIQNWEKDLHIRRWLDGNLKTAHFKKWLKRKYQWVEYLSFLDFLRGVEEWLTHEKE